MAMTKEEFRERWDSGDDGGGITFDDIKRCAIEWGLYKRPMIIDPHLVAAQVIRAAGCKDQYEYGEENQDG